MEAIDQILCRHRPGLLVSVRNADEALAALAGGADVIDVKEPSRGSLGAADRSTIAEVVRVIDGRAPVTAAAGELVDLMPMLEANSSVPLSPGVSLAKIGLSQCGILHNWQAHWQKAIAAIQIAGSDNAQPVAVIYADWQAARTPNPDQIYSLALAIGCRVVLIDTWIKSSGTLFDHWPTEDLRHFVDRVQISGKIAVVLAGSLTDTNLLRAAELRPKLVAVRGAACDAGRESSISQNGVAKLRQLLDDAWRSKDEHRKTSIQTRARSGRA